MQPTLRALVVEDHIDLAANIMDYLRARGHLCEVAYDGVTASRLALERDFDVIVLDLMLPALDGIGVCRRLRDAGSTSRILMLTARDGIADKLDGFDAGTDDYLTKPFALEELDARLRALARRPRTASSTTWRIADLEIDVARHVARRGGRPLDLTPAGFRLLVELARASPNLVRRDRLEAALWADEPPLTDALRSQIYLLRQAIDRGFDRALLITVHGVGYRLGVDE